MEDWLPPHQRHLLFTLAHIDAGIERLVRVLYDYVLLGPIECDYRILDGRKDVLVRRISPIPEAVPRLVSDVLRLLHASIDHALLAEIEHLTARALTPAEVQAVGMPVMEDRATLAAWVSQTHLRTLPALQTSGPLRTRIESLQPFAHADQQRHPLKVLAEYNDLSKHRMPAVAVVRLGTVVLEHRAAGLTLVGEEEDDGPLSAGDALVSVPAGMRVPMEIWPAIGIRRPCSGTWVVLMRELRDLEVWVRTQALPILIKGTAEVDPLPPHLDISVAYADYCDAFAAAQGTPAAERQQLRPEDQDARKDLPEVFRQKLPDVPTEAVEAFVSTLSDADSAAIIQRYLRVRENRGERSAIGYLRRQLGLG